MAERSHGSPHAVRSGSSEAAKALIAAGAGEINTKDNYGWTPLHAAVLSDNATAAAMLLGTRGIDGSAADKVREKLGLTRSRFHV